MVGIAPKVGIAPMVGVAPMIGIAPMVRITPIVLIARAMAARATVEADTLVAGSVARIPCAATVVVVAFVA